MLNSKFLSYVLFVNSMIIGDYTSEQKRPMISGNLYSSLYSYCCELVIITYGKNKKIKIAFNFNTSG